MRDFVSYIHSRIILVSFIHSRVETRRKLALIPNAITYLYLIAAFKNIRF